MKQIQINVKARETLGKGRAREARRSGMIPAEIYGAGLPNEHVLIDERELRAAIRAGAVKSLVDLRYADGGKASLAIIKEAQSDALGDKIHHVDFFRITPDQPIQFSLAVVIKGRAKGEAVGGIVEHLARVLKVEGLPADIPDEIVLDITPLEVGQTIHVRDVTHYDGVAFLDPADTGIIAVKTMRGATSEEQEAEKAAAAAATAAAATAEAEAAEKAQADAKGAAKAPPRGKKG